MKKLKIGIFGLFRGMEYVHNFTERSDTMIYAVMDKDPARVAEAKTICGEDVKVCNTFEELVSSGIEAVYLANYFHEHAKYAIIAMEHGVDVLSECTSAATMRDCVLLWEAVERTGRKYMLAENAPYFKQALELKRMYETGTLGKLLYAEAEYNHYNNASSGHFLPNLKPFAEHWRNYLPRTYYLTHTLGPLMFMTGEWPVRVNAFAAHSEQLQNIPVKDALAMMTCVTDKGALYRFSGCTTMPGGYGFRVVGENGLAETGRGYGEQISLMYKDYLIPEGHHEQELYKPEWPQTNEQVNAASHGGADWWVAKGFADYILRDEYPFFDYKCGIVMSIVAILAWRSILSGGNAYEIPDFSKKEVRDMYRDDNATPFVGANQADTLPCTSPDY